MRGICGSFFLYLSCSRSQVFMKKSSNDTFFVQKEVLGEEIIIWIKYGNIFTQIMIYSHYENNVYKLVSFGKNVVFYASLRKFTKYLQNISWSNVFGKFFLIVHLTKLTAWEQENKSEKKNSTLESTGDTGLASQCRPASLPISSSDRLSSFWQFCLSRR